MFPTALTAALAAERQKTYRAEATHARHASTNSGATAGRIQLAVRTQINQARRALARPARPAACGCEC